MSVNPLIPNDPRVENKFLSVGDYTYHYFLAKPNRSAIATVVLLHGWYVYPSSNPWSKQLNYRW